MLHVLLKMFVNLFDDPKITPARFLDFSMFVYDAMDDANDKGKYDAEMAIVQSVIDSVHAEINGVDTNLHTQVNNTSVVKRFIKGFSKFMITNNGAISYALGGEDTDAFRQFYPYKNIEYIKANRATLPMLTARVSSLATTYADQLGTKLAADLQAFAPDYKKALSTQRKQITTVKRNRTDRNTAFEDGQWQMTGVVHSVAGSNLRTPQAAQELFPFTMLYPHNGQHPLYLRGSLEASESRELLNYTLKADTEVSIKNNSVNATIMVWLAMTPDAPAPETGVMIEPNKKVTVTADKLGDLKGTFLMVKNTSDVNKASYVIGVLGIKREDDKVEGEVKSISLKIAS